MVLQLQLVNRRSDECHRGIVERPRYGLQMRRKHVIGKARKKLGYGLAHREDNSLICE